MGKDKSNDVDGVWKYVVNGSGWRTLICPFCEEAALVDACDISVKFDIRGRYFVKQLQTKYCPNCGKRLRKAEEIL